MMQVPDLLIRVALSSATFLLCRLWPRLCPQPLVSDPLLTEVPHRRGLGTDLRQRAGATEGLAVLCPFSQGSESCTDRSVSVNLCFTHFVLRSGH